MKYQTASKPRPPQARPKASATLYELEVVPGLEEVVTEELQERLGGQTQVRHTQMRYAETGVLTFAYPGNANQLLGLRTALAAYRVGHFAIPRPSALLGDQNWRTLLQLVQPVLRLHPAQSFQTLGLSAAGAESPVMQRIQSQLAAALQLTVTPEHEADLLVRLRPAQHADNGWEALIRLSPRPLSVRPWRVQDVKGALNATVAASMVRLTQPQAGDRFVNLCCGSGTLLIERARHGPAQQVLGYDHDATMLEHAQANIKASKLTKQIATEQCDVRTLPLPNASVDALCADPPFGIAIGAHQENTQLYPALLQEAARIAKPGARFVLITQEVRLMEQWLTPDAPWQMEEALKLTLRGLHPRLYVLRRR